MNIRFNILIVLLLFSSSFGAEISDLIPEVRSKFVFIAGGSGAVISHDGYVITNNHVVGPGRSFGIALGDGRTFRAKLIGRDSRGDLALLKIEGAKGLAFFVLGDSDALAIGEMALAVGNPLSLGMDDREPTFTAGVISALHQFRRGYNDAIVTDAPINPGNSGGPLINSKGELVGINGMTQTRIGMKSNTGVGFAIPSNQIKLWLPFLKAAEGGNVFHGRITGISFLENNGVLQVEKVASGSEAAAAGFKINDILLSFMERKVYSIARFNSIQGLYPAGTSISAVVENNGDKRTLRFALPPLKNWRQSFTLARPTPKDKYPVIETVFPDTDTARAGLKAGDRIIAIGSSPVSISAFSRIARYFTELSSGDKVSLTVKRGTESINIDFTAE